MDEPEAALSPASQMELLAHIQRLTEDGSQVVLATHSPMLMTYPGACLLQIDEDGIRPIEYHKTSITRSPGVFWKTRTGCTASCSGRDKACTGSALATAQGGCSDRRSTISRPG